MGKTRDLFKKIIDIKRTFHAKIGTIKDRNGMDLREAEKIKMTIILEGKNHKTLHVIHKCIHILNSWFN